MSSEPHGNYCVFCEIIAAREPATFAHKDDVCVVFKNRLTWVPVMLLVVPRKHVTQAQLWLDPALMGHISQVAAEMGAFHSPGGFRILSNFGRDAMQSQEHGHVHVIGGTHLGPYA